MTADQPAPDGAPILLGRGLACERGGRLVFAGVDFAVAAGEALVVRGPNGAGKSTLLRLVAGLLRPAAGALTWQGLDVLDDVEGQRARIAYVGHLDAVKPVLTVAETVGFLAADPASAAGAIERFGLAHLAEVPGRLLSAGQRRRTALARTLAAGRPLWLLDEPTIGLDDDGLVRLEGVLRAHLAEGGTAMVSTHVDLGLAAQRTLPLVPAPPSC